MVLGSRIANLSGLSSLGTSVYQSSCAVTEEGEVRCWGQNDRLQLGSEDPLAGRSEPTTVAGLHEVRSVGTGFHHSCALTEAGEVYCWGDNTQGQLGHPGNGSASPVKVEPLSDVVELAVSGYHTCVRKEDNQVLCWGQNDAGQLGRGFSTPSESSPGLVEFE